MPTYCNEKEIQYVNRETGELITSTLERTYSYRVKDNDEFVMLYYRHILRAMTKINSLGTTRLMVYLASIADYNTGKVSLGAADRKLACETLGINSANFTRHIREL